MNFRLHVGNTTAEIILPIFIAIYRWKLFIGLVWPRDIVTTAPNVNILCGLEMIWRLKPPNTMHTMNVALIDTMAECGIAILPINGTRRH